MESSNYHEIDVFKVNQKEKSFFVGKMSARLLLKAFTVIPAIYDIDKASSLATTYKDDKEYAEFRLDLERKIDEAELNDFERKLDKRRVKEISNFLNSDDYALFPNTVIVMCDLINDNIDIPSNASIEDVKQLIGNNDNNLAYLKGNQDEGYKIYIPENKNSLLVIDGQHRLKGLQESNDEVKDNYEVLVSFITGFDRAIVAKLFYTINYTQKPVNKSLLYHLMGEFSHNIDELTFLHELVRVLNEFPESPLYKRVKMLGTVDSDLSREDKDQMTISQAFLIDYLLRSIDSEAKSGIYQPIFLAYYQNESLQVEIVRFIMNYFKAIQQLNLDDWNDPQNSILCKTIGIGAFIRVLYLIFVKMFVEDFEFDLLKIKDESTDTIRERLKNCQTIDFSTDGEYGKAASGGSLNKLREEIISKIKYFDDTEGKNFSDYFRENYLNPYKQWMNRNT